MQLCRAVDECGTPASVGRGVDNGPQFRRLIAEVDGIWGVPLRVGFIVADISTPAENAVVFAANAGHANKRSRRDGMRSDERNRRADRSRPMLFVFGIVPPRAIAATFLWTPATPEPPLDCPLTAQNENLIKIRE
jgi:hypothetical protein